MISSSSTVTIGNEHRLPPAAKEIEQAVLGIIMLERDAIDTVVHHLRKEMFYLDAHQTIFDAMVSLNNKSQLITIFSATEELTARGEIDVCGGAYYVTSLTNRVTNAAGLEQYCLIILQRFMQREMIRIGAEIHQEGYNSNGDVFEQLDRAESLVLGISAGLGESTATMDDALISTIKLIEKNRALGQLITGVPSGFAGLDRVTRGFQEDDLIIIGARPAVGKTALALQLARSAARAGHATMIFSLEMSKERLTMRNLAAEGEMDIYRLQIGRLDDAQMKDLHQEAVAPLSKLPIFIEDKPGLNPWKLRAKLRRAKKKHNIRFAIIDYLQLMEGEGENRERQIANISRSLKNVARELHISIIALSQLSREIEKRGAGAREPQLSDLRESGAIEQDADLVCFLWGPTDQDIARDPTIADERYLKISKARDGNLTRLTLTFNGSFQTFKEKSGQLVPLSNASGYKPHPTNPDLFEKS